MKIGYWWCDMGLYRKLCLKYNSLFLSEIVYYESKSPKGIVYKQIIYL